MSGSERREIVLQERDRHLLREIGTMRVVDRELAKIVAGFRSTTRANTRLLKLTKAGLLRRFFLGPKAFYWLSAAAAQLVGIPHRGPRRKQDAVLAADYFVEHQLEINRVYCGLRYGAADPGLQLERWSSFYEPVLAGLRLIPDGYAELRVADELVSMFIEVDLGNENLSVWKEKVSNYLQLATTGAFQRDFGQTRFRVVVLVNGERRLASIRKTVAAQTDKIFWFATLIDVHRSGLLAPVWFRPTRDLHVPFVKSTP